MVLEVGTADRPGEGKLRVSGQNEIFPTIPSPLRKNFPMDLKHHGSLLIFLPCFCCVVSSVDDAIGGKKRPVEVSGSPASALTQT